jgi:hypothetical protein
MQNISDVRQSLGAQEKRLSSLTRSLSNARPEGVSPGSRNLPQLAQPEVRSLFTSMVDELHNISVLATRGEQASKEVEEARSSLQTLSKESAALSVASPRQLGRQSNSSDEVQRLFVSLRRELSASVDGLRKQVMHLTEGDDRRAEFAAEVRKDLSSMRTDLDTFKEQIKCIASLPQPVSLPQLTSNAPVSSDVAVLRGTLAETATLLSQS